MKKNILTIALIFFIGFGIILPLTVMADELKENAESPELVFSKFVDAVHRKDINVVKKLVYSKEAILWEKDSRSMLSMLLTVLPRNPILQSKTESREYQYHYTIMEYIGNSPKTKQKVWGQVRMIVEDGEWKVFQQLWKHMTR